MIRKICAVLLVTLGLSLTGCKFERGLAGSGVRKTEKRDLKSFSAIDTTGAYTIDVTCQKPAGVEIEADDNILPLIETEVRDGILFVSNTQPYHSSKTVSLRITLPELNSIANHGAGEIKIVDLNSSDLKIDSTGAASVDAAGTAKSIQISSTGAGEIDTSKLHADKAKVDVSGAASVDVYASEQLDVNVSGAGHVSYRGNPKTINKHVSGIGSVDPSGGS